MRLDGEKLAKQIEIIRNTRLEDIADFDGTYYTIKDPKSELNAAIKSMKICKGQITKIQMYSEKGGSGGLTIGR